MNHSQQSLHFASSRRRFKAFLQLASPPLCSLDEIWADADINVITEVAGGPPGQRRWVSKGLTQVVSSERKCAEVRGLAAAAAAARRFEAVLCHALRGQLRQNIVQVVGVGVAVARQVGHHLRFVVDAVPHHRVGLSGRAGRSHGEDEASHPRHLQQLQHLFSGERE